MADLVDMPVALPPSKRQSVHAHYLLGTRPDDIVARTGVSKRSVERIKHNLSNYGTTTRPKVAKQGRHRLMTVEMEEVRDLPCFCCCANFRHSKSSSTSNHQNMLTKWCISFGMSLM